MFSRTPLFAVVFLFLTQMPAAVRAEDNPTMLFDFSKPDALQQWQTVNDGVMGGVSDGNVRITEKNLEFYGTLSLENNGGFASVRTKAAKIDLSKYDGLVFKVRGDGRNYYLNVHVPSDQIAFSYQASFKTEKDKWTEVTIPFTDLKATSFGSVVEKGKPLTPVMSKLWASSWPTRRPGRSSWRFPGSKEPRRRASEEGMAEIAMAGTILNGFIFHAGELEAQWLTGGPRISPAQFGAIPRTPSQLVERPPTEGGGRVRRLLDDSGPAAAMELRSSASGRLGQGVETAAGDRRGSYLWRPLGFRPPPQLRSAGHGRRMPGILANAPALYYPYVEPQPGECRRLFAAVSGQACVVVTDDYPIALPAVRTIEADVPVRVEKIDGNGLLPLRAADQAFPTAYAFRRFLQRTLREHLLDTPQSNPFVRVELPRLKSLPPPIARRWPAASPRLLSGETAVLAALPIDHSVPAAPSVGGPAAAHARWKRFLGKKLASYSELRNQPEVEINQRPGAVSPFWPYLHPRDVPQPGPTGRMVAGTTG